MLQLNDPAPLPTTCINGVRSKVSTAGYLLGSEHLERNTSMSTEFTSASVVCGKQLL